MPKKPIPNIPLLRKTMEYIEAFPQEWDQRYYYYTEQGDDGNICKTTMCFAGTACFLSGYTEFDGDKGSVTNPQTGRQRDIMVVAREALGLTNEQAWALFEAAWQIDTPARMRELVEETVGEKL